MPPKKAPTAALSPLSEMDAVFIEPAPTITVAIEEKELSPVGPALGAHVPHVYKPKSVSLVNPSLQDMPYCYLLDRSSWSDFKRALTNCGLSWNLPDWMQTVVYKGKQYMDIITKKPELDLYFVPNNLITDEGKKVPVGINKEFIDLLGFPSNMGEYMQPSQRYCNLSRMEFESDSKLPSRQKLWTWFVQCLQGPRAQPGPFHYLTHQCMVYDISFLFKRLWEVLETVTICSLDDEVYTVTHMEFNPKVQDLFSYIEDLRRAIRRLNDLNERCQRKDAWN